MREFFFRISYLAFIFGVNVPKNLILGWVMDGYGMVEPWPNPGRMTDERTMRQDRLTNR